MGICTKFDKFGEYVKVAHLLGYKTSLTYQDKSKKIVNIFIWDDVVEIEMQITKNRFVIITTLEHPTKGHTELQRKTLDPRVAIAILCNPREHTRQNFDIAKGKHMYKRKIPWEEKMLKSVQGVKVQAK